jgi:hypothetical protein
MSRDKVDSCSVRQAELTLRWGILSEQHSANTLAEFGFFDEHGSKSFLVRDVLELPALKLLNYCGMERLKVKVIELQHWKIARSFVDLCRTAQPHGDESIARK